jgi:hypothetical protein
MDFGMKEWGEYDPAAVLRAYRQFVYETGAVDTGKGKPMDAEVVARERKAHMGTGSLLKKFRPCVIQHSSFHIPILADALSCKPTCRKEASHATHCPICPF